MKYIVIAAGCFAASISLAAAQTAPQSPPTSSNTNLPAAGTPGDNAATAPMPGKNSFTEAQARARLEKQGYTQVSALTKDDQSIWRGTAMKDSKSVSVAVDYQGHVSGN